MADPVPLTFAVIGIDHPHVLEQTACLLELGCTCAGFQADGEPGTLEGFRQRFPRIERVDDPRRLLEDPRIALIVTAAVPDQRAGIAVAAMAHGKDVMSDKPGCTTLEQLEEIRRAQAATGRIWSVCFSERFAVRAVTRAAELVAQGAIGRVVHLVGLGPHRLNKARRPVWFFERARYGGILCDLASHQIDQFLHLTGSTDAAVVASAVANYANPEEPGLEDFGEVVLRSDRATGYARVDWYTPDGLATWGDGRLTILGTEGFIEVRKYIDLAGRAGGDHLFLVARDATRHLDCSDAPLPYYPSLVRDVQDRTETAMPQAHCFMVTELALTAQASAVCLSRR
jgi:predicted dehydrogenase